MLTILTRFMFRVNLPPFDRSPIIIPCLLEKALLSLYFSAGKPGWSLTESAESGVGHFLNFAVGKSSTKNNTWLLVN